MGWGRLDDLDGKLGATAQTFGAFGKAYWVDLNPDGRRRLEEALRPFLAVAKEYGSLPELPGDVDQPPAPGAAPASPSSRTGQGRVRRSKKAPPVVQSSSTIRAWAQENGFPVGPKGRIAKAIVEQYEAAHA